MDIRIICQNKKCFNISNMGLDVGINRALCISTQKMHVLNFKDLKFRLFLMNLVQKRHHFRTSNQLEFNIDKVSRKGFPEEKNQQLSTKKATYPYNIGTKRTRLNSQALFTS